MSLELQRREELTSQNSCPFIPNNDKFSLRDKVQPPHEIRFLLLCWMKHGSMKSWISEGNYYTLWNSGCYEIPRNERTPQKAPTIISLTFDSSSGNKGRRTTLSGYYHNVQWISCTLNIIHFTETPNCNTHTPFVVKGKGALQQVESEFVEKGASSTYYVDLLDEG